MHILFTTQCCCTTREVVTIASYFKHQSHLPGWAGETPGPIGLHCCRTWGMCSDSFPATDEQLSFHFDTTAASIRYAIRGVMKPTNATCISATNPGMCIFDVGTLIKFYNLSLPFCLIYCLLLKHLSLYFLLSVTDIVTSCKLTSAGGGWGRLLWFPSESATPE